MLYITVKVYLSAKLYVEGVLFHRINVNYSFMGECNSNP